MPQIRRYGTDSEPRISPPDDPPPHEPPERALGFYPEERIYLIECVRKRPPGYLNATALISKLENLRDIAASTEDYEEDDE
jgi:hypothetical protein